LQKSNGSKLIAKGVLDSGSTPDISTKCPSPLQQCTWWLSDGDEFGFDRASNNLRATSEATDLISAKLVNANDDVYNMALAA
jgi:hypothetical protein